MDTRQGFPDLIVAELIEGVEIRPDRAGEENRVLWDDGETRAEVVEFDLRNIDAVDSDAPFAALKEAEEGERQC